MKELLKKDITKLTKEQFRIKYDMIKYDMYQLNLQKQSKRHLINIMKLYREFKNNEK